MVEIMDALDSMFYQHRVRLAELAAKSRLPAMWGLHSERWSESSGTPWPDAPTAGADCPLIEALYREAPNQAFQLPDAPDRRHKKVLGARTILSRPSGKRNTGRGSGCGEIGLNVAGIL